MQFRAGISEVQQRKKIKGRKMTKQSLNEERFLMNMTIENRITDK